MTTPTDLHKVEEVIVLLRKARLLLAPMTGVANDLDALLSVADSEAKRLYVSILSDGTKSEGVPLIMSEPGTSEKKRKPKHR